MLWDTLWPCLMKGGKRDRNCRGSFKVLAFLMKRLLMLSFCLRWANLAGERKRRGRLAVFPTNMNGQQRLHSGNSRGSSKQQKEKPEFNAWPGRGRTRASATPSLSARS